MTIGTHRIHKGKNNQVQCSVVFFKGEALCTFELGLKVQYIGDSAKETSRNVHVCVMVALISPLHTHTHLHIDLMGGRLTPDVHIALQLRDSLTSHFTSILFL